MMMSCVTKRRLPFDNPVSPISPQRFKWDMETIHNKTHAILMTAQSNQRPPTPHSPIPSPPRSNSAVSTGQIEPKVLFPSMLPQPVPTINCSCCTIATNEHGTCGYCQKQACHSCMTTCCTCNQLFCSFCVSLE